MGRILALDLGSKRIGLAITDEDKIIAQPLGITASPENAHQVLEDLKTDFDIEKIVVGLPKSLSGEEGPQAQKIKIQAEKISEYLNLPVEYLDERLTTKQAFNILNRDKNIPIDSLAAQKILEQYLKLK